MAILSVGHLLLFPSVQYLFNQKVVGEIQQILIEQGLEHLLDDIDKAWTKPWLSVLVGCTIGISWVIISMLMLVKWLYAQGPAHFNRVSVNCATAFASALVPAAFASAASPVELLLAWLLSENTSEEALGSILDCPNLNVSFFNTSDLENLNNPFGLRMEIVFPLIVGVVSGFINWTAFYLALRGEYFFSCKKLPFPPLSQRAQVTITGPSYGTADPVLTESENGNYFE